MSRKTKNLILSFIIILLFTLLTCDLLDRPIVLILPGALHAGDDSLSDGEGIVQIYDFEEDELIVELEVISSDKDDDDNNDDVDLSKILTVPAFVKIPEDELSVTFTCESFNTDMGGHEQVNITVRATARHYQDTEDTIIVYDADAGTKTEP